MSFRDSDEPCPEERGIRGRDGTPADVSYHSKRQKTSDFDNLKPPRNFESSTAATSLSPNLRHQHSQHSGYMGPILSTNFPPGFPSTLDFGGLKSLFAMKDIAAKSEGEVEATSRGIENILSDDSMGLIAIEVRRIITRKGAIKATLVLGWDLLDFMKTQYPDDGNAKLGSVITLSGWVLRAQATTCSDYAQKMWPAQGLNVIMAFQSAMSSHDHKAQGP